MKEITTGKFKKDCLRFVDQVQRTREPILVTKSGKPLAKLVPVDRPDDDIFGYMAGKVKIVGDIISPITPPEDWHYR